MFFINIFLLVVLIWVKKVIFLGKVWLKGIFIEKDFFIDFFVKYYVFIFVFFVLVIVYNIFCLRSSVDRKYLVCEYNFVYV